MSSFRSWMRSSTPRVNGRTGRRPGTSLPKESLRRPANWLEDESTWGIGRLTAETFSAGSLSGGYAYTYDGRGQQTASTLTVGAASDPLGTTYDDAGNVLTQAYPDGESITNSYTAQGWLSGVSTTRSGT